MILSSNDSKRKTSSFTLPKKKSWSDIGDMFKKNYVTLDELEVKNYLDSEGMKELAHWIESKPINDNTIRVLCEFLRGE
jgi:hypothetical protein